MFDISDAHHSRKVVAGLCMMAAPALGLVATIVSPSLKSDEAAQLAVVAGDPDRWYVSNLLGLVAIVLAVPAVLGLMHMLRERQVAAGHVGGAFALFGLMMLMAGTAIAMVVWQMAAGGADQAQMAALLDRVNTTTGTFIPFFLGQFAFAVGMLALGWGLWQAHAVHWFMAFCMGGGAIALTAGFASASITWAIIGAAALFVGLGSVGRMVLAETDAEWEHTPEFRGFRPAAMGR
jgi:hypothetical protein